MEEVLDNAYFYGIKALFHGSVNRHASDPRIGLMDSTVSVERW